MAGGHFGGGSGSIYNPFVVEDVLDFLRCCERVEAETDVHYVLANDIDTTDYIVENGWSEVYIAFNNYNKTIQGAGHKIIFTEHRSTPFISGVSDYYNGSELRIKNLRIVTNSDTDSDCILINAGQVDKIILNNVFIDYDVSDFTKVLFHTNYSQNLTYCRYCTFKIYNSGECKLPDNSYRRINVFGAVEQQNIYRCRVHYDIDVKDDSYMTIGRTSTVYFTLVPLRSVETVLSGVFSLDVTCLFDFDYQLEDCLCSFEFHLLDNCINCYSTLNVLARAGVKYAGEHDYDESTLDMKTDIKVLMYSGECCYQNGLVHLEQFKNNNYEQGTFEIHNFYTGYVIPENKYTYQYCNLDKLVYCGHNESSFGRVHDGYLTDTEMHDKDYFIGFDFFKPSFPLTLGIWGMSSSINNGYPFLWWLELNYRLTLKIQSNNSQITVPIKRLGFDKSDLIFSIQPFGDEHRAIHLVDVTDSTALPIRIMTPDGIKAFSSKEFKYDFDMI